MVWVDPLTCTNSLASCRCGQSRRGEGRTKPPMGNWAEVIVGKYNSHQNPTSSWPNYRNSLRSFHPHCSCSSGVTSFIWCTWAETALPECLQSHSLWFHGSQLALGWPAGSKGHVILNVATPAQKTGQPNKIPRLMHWGQTVQAREGKMILLSPTCSTLITLVPWGLAWCGKEWSRKPHIVSSCSGSPWPGKSPPCPGSSLLWAESWPMQI